MINKNAIEAIYPLSFMQQGLLMHHLSAQADQGYLNTECMLKGNFDINIFKESCIVLTQRHEAIRSTIHWRNLENQVQVVHKNKHIEITYEDLTDASEDAQNIYWNKLKREYLDKGANLESGALLKIYVIKIKESVHRLLWPMHHILLDGWSGSIILRDLVKIYNYKYRGENLNLTPLPNYKSYLNWVKAQPENEAKLFWSNYFEGFKHAHLFSKKLKTASKSENASSIKSLLFSISGDTVDNLNSYCKTNKITKNTFFQGIWSLTLSRFFNTTDVVHGTTVSGRTSDFPNMDSIAGMFMNLQPIRADIEEKMTISNWFRSTQKNQFEARNYEHVELNTLYTYFDWPENSTLFDSLVVFENYPSIKNTNEELELSDLKSGLTSTYPVTLIILPEKEIKATINFNSYLISDDTVQWLLKSLKTIIEHIIYGRVESYEELKQTISPFLNSASEVDETVFHPNEEYKAPKNKTELELVKIWEQTLGLKNISTSANFFELGGKSMMAVKMFASINKKLKTKIPATKLLEYPTIAELSDSLLSESNNNSLKLVVPIRLEGNNPPLFCIHAGGGHVFFYGLLKDYLKKESPIYAIRPSGLNKGEKLHESIEIMAEEYLKAIKEIQPNGPYNILVHCFSTSVGNEIAYLLDKTNENINLIVVDTIASSWGGTGDVSTQNRISFFLKRFIKSPIKTISTFISARYYLIEHWYIKFFGKTYEKELEKVKTSLRKVSVKYQFKPHQGKVSLILCNNDEEVNNFIIESWKKLAKGGVDLFYSKGRHGALFQEPDVKFVSEQIDLTIKD